MSNYQLVSYSEPQEHIDARTYPSSISRELQPWPNKYAKPSDLYRVVVVNSQHPPLMQAKSWNLAVPYKEQKFFHTPSESIVNNYTPTAANLKIRHLPQSLRSSQSMSLDTARLMTESKIKFNQSIDLKRNRHSARDAKRPKLKASSFPASRSISPREQIETMNLVEKAINRIIKEPSDLDNERYQYYIEHGPDKSMIAPLPANQFEVFYRLIKPELRNHPFMKTFEPTLIEDVTSDYEYSMRKAIVDYVLMNFEERQRVKIEWVPRPFALKYYYYYYCLLLGQKL